MIRILPRRFLMLTLLISACLCATADASISFFQSAVITIPRKPKALAIADFDNDGNDDVAVASSGSNKVSILLIGPNGEFRQAVSIRIGTSLRSLATGDFDGDGNTDVVVSTGNRNAYVIFGSGDGTFRGSKLLTRCCRGGNVISADVDGTNGPDLIFSNLGKDDVSVFANKGGTGTFNNEKRFHAGKRPENLVAADFNADGFPDVAALNTRGRGNDATIFLSVPGGNLAPVADFITQKRSRVMTAADLDPNPDGTGLPDLVTGNPGTNEVAILLNLGGGFFEAPIIQPFFCSTSISFEFVPCTLRDIVVADFDNNHVPDIAVALSFTGASLAPGGNDTIDIAAGLGNETYATPVRIPGAGEGLRILKLGDFNGDGKFDLAAASTGDSTVRIFINNSTTPPIGPTVTRAVGTSTPTPTGGVGGTPTSTPTVSTSGLLCDTSRGDADCISPRPPFCSLTGPGTQGICCDTPCDGANERCDLPGFEGTCKPTSLNNGEPCDASGQCNSNVCAQGYCCNTACDGINFQCDSPGNVGNCVAVGSRATPTGSVPPPPTTTPTRTPTSNGGFKNLGESCTSGSECVSPQICDPNSHVCCSGQCASGEGCDLAGGEGVCLKESLPNGSECSARGQCESGNCPPGSSVCCEEPCEGANQHCDASGICVTAFDATPTSTPLPPGATPTRTATQVPTRTLPSAQVIAARGSGCSIGSDQRGDALGWLLLLPIGLWLATTRTSLVARVRRSRVRIERN